MEWEGLHYKHRLLDMHLSQTGAPREEASNPSPEQQVETSQEKGGVFQAEGRACVKAWRGESTGKNESNCLEALHVDTN